jgi:Delta7-sterol 5-desaturase
MLCSIAEHGSLLSTWLAITAIGLPLMLSLSVLLFWRSYWRPTFEQWQRKSHPAYPAPAVVRREVLQMLKGAAAATLPAALSLHLVSGGGSKAYCGVGEFGAGYLILSFFVVFLVTDFAEFAYHQLGHRLRFAWREHKAHHVFHNPTPFAVIADEPVDQFVRALPLLLFPLVMPINVDLLFFTFALFFYGYGAYLHWGYELRWPDAHHPWLNTAHQHYLHHARATLHRPYHTGFFLKLWDQLAGSCYTGACDCSRCARQRGERSWEAWQRLEKPDYRPLLEPSFWWRGTQRAAAPALRPH